MKIKDFGPSTWTDPQGKVLPQQHHFVFECPGCGYGHPFFVPAWSWNGSLDKPTFTPSLLVDHARSRCHLFMTDGIIQFLLDCHHALKGQKVPCPEYEES